MTALAFKRLNLIPQGHVTGGYFEYSLDGDTGNVSYQGEVDFHVLFFSKAFPVQGSTVIPANCVKSASIKQDAMFTFGDLNLHVDRVAGTQALVSINATMGGVPVKGSGLIDLSGTNIALTYIKLSGSYFGVDAIVEAKI